MFYSHRGHVDSYLGVVLSHVVVGYVGVGYDPVGVLGDSGVRETCDRLF